MYALAMAARNAAMDKRVIALAVVLAVLAAVVTFIAVRYTGVAPQHFGALTAKPAGTWHWE